VTPVPAAAYGWSFLVARGRSQGHQTVLAPDFLTARNLQGRLEDVARGVEWGQRQMIDLDIPEVGRVAVIYTTEQLTAAALDGRATRDDVLPTDEYGRPLELLYGIVTREQLCEPLDEHDLETARAESLQTYRRFLADEDSFRVDASRRFLLRTSPEPEPPPEPEPKDDEGRGHGPLVAIAAAATIAVVLLVVWLMWPTGHSSVDIVKASIDPERGAVQCGVPVEFKLRATIKADGPAEVSYHWKDADGSRTNAASLNFKEEGKQAVDRAVTRTIAADTTSGNYLLVIDDPSRQRRPLNYELTCLTAATGTIPGAEAASAR
jgi:hypothetical protein